MGISIKKIVRQIDLIKARLCAIEGSGGPGGASYSMVDNSDGTYDLTENGSPEGDQIINSRGFYNDETGGFFTAFPVSGFTPTNPASPNENDYVITEYDNGHIVSVYQSSSWDNVFVEQCFTNDGGDIDLTNGANFPGFDPDDEEDAQNQIRTYVNANPDLLLGEGTRFVYSTVVAVNDWTLTQTLAYASIEGLVVNGNNQLFAAPTSNADFVSKVQTAIANESGIVTSVTVNDAVTDFAISSLVLTQSSVSIGQFIIGGIPDGSVAVSSNPDTVGNELVWIMANGCTPINASFTDTNFAITDALESTTDKTHIWSGNKKLTIASVPTVSGGLTQVPRQILTLGGDTTGTTTGFEYQSDGETGAFVGIEKTSGTPTKTRAVSVLSANDNVGGETHSAFIIVGSGISTLGQDGATQVDGGILIRANQAVPSTWLDNPEYEQGNVIIEGDVTKIFGRDIQISAGAALTQNIILTDFGTGSQVQGSPTYALTVLSDGTLTETLISSFGGGGGTQMIAEYTSSNGVAIADGEMLVPLNSDLGNSAAWSNAVTNSSTASTINIISNLFPVANVAGTLKARVTVSSGVGTIGTDDLSIGLYKGLAADFTTTGANIDFTRVADQASGSLGTSTTSRTYELDGGAIAVGDRAYVSFFADNGDDISNGGVSFRVQIYIEE